MRYFLLGTIGVIIMLGLLTFGFYHSKKVKEREYIKVKYSSSGNSLGNVDIVEIDLVEKKVISRYTPVHNEKVTVKEYRVSDKDINEFKEILASYNYYGLRLRKDSGLQVLDGPSTYVEFTLSNDKDAKIYYTLMLTKKDRAALKKVTDKLFSLQNEKKLIKEYKEDW